MLEAHCYRVVSSGGGRQRTVKWRRHGHEWQVKRETIHSGNTSRYDGTTMCPYWGRRWSRVYSTTHHNGRLPVYVLYCSSTWQNICREELMEHFRVCFDSRLIPTHTFVFSRRGSSQRASVQSSPSGEGDHEEDGTVDLSGLAFVERQEEWLRRKQTTLRAKTHEVERAVKNAATFNPNLAISQSSLRPAQVRQASMRHIPPKFAVCYLQNRWCRAI